MFILHSQKANCITVFPTGCPHSLGSCHFRGVCATCRPHTDGGVPLSALSKNTNELAGLFSTTSLKCLAPSRKAVDTIFLSLLVLLDKGNKPQVYRLRSGRSNHYPIASVQITLRLQLEWEREKYGLNKELPHSKASGVRAANQEKQFS